MKWALVCKFKKEEGLGLTSIRHMNLAILGKWLSRVGEEEDSLWKSVLLAKYGILKNDWDIQKPNYRASRLWRGILSSKEAFPHNVKFKLRSGDTIFRGYNFLLN